MSKPLENYIIRIKSSIDQFDNEGVIREEDRDHIELMTRGSFTKKNRPCLPTPLKQKR